MKAIFHIGRPKTGSTTIQVFLHQNRAALAEHGILYRLADPEVTTQIEFPVAALSACEKQVVDPYMARVYGLTSVSAQRAFADRRLQVTDAALSEHPDMHTWVGSSEHVYPYLKRVHHVAALDALLCRRFDAVRYVVYLRRQEDLIPSAYVESVRRGDTIAFPDFIERFLAREQGDHMKRLRLWRRVVGADRIDVRLLERDALVGGDLIDDWCHMLGVDPAGLVRTPAKNESLAARDLERLRRLNVLIDGHRAESAVFQRLHETLTSALVRGGRRGADKLRLSPDQVARIRAANAASNERVRKIWFPERDELFPPRPSAAPCVGGAAQGRPNEGKARDHNVPATKPTARLSAGPNGLAMEGIA